jgi:hypothetical protein
MAGRGLRFNAKIVHKAGWIRTRGFRAIERDDVLLYLFCTVKRSIWAITIFRVV